MIKTTDLRIGNLVLFNPLKTIKRICVVKELKERFVLVIDQGLDLSLSYTEAQPIPLTPEILEACGFVKKHNTGYWQFYALNNGWHIGEWVINKHVAGWEKKGAFYYGDSYMHVKYLHQLQNLYFALVEQELTYNPIIK